MIEGSPEADRYFAELERIEEEYFQALSSLETSLQEKLRLLREKYGIWQKEEGK